MKCPRDSQPLVFVDDGRHMRDRCPECEGVLLDRDEVVSALGRRPGKGAASPAGQVDALAPSGLACPRDGAAMRRLVHREVELDLCPECSALWLDPGELDKISHRKRGAGKAAVAAGALAAGGALAAAAATPEKQSLVSGLGEAAAEIAVEGAIDLVFEFAVEAIGALFS
jgi:Zn-finger nucleic acid-binding protein